MITKKELNILFVKITSDYYELWDILLVLKRISKRNIIYKDLVDFQVLLGKALFKLSKKHISITSEKKTLITKKHTLAPPWFKNRMKLLSNYQDIIDNYIRVGRSLGDSFCWLFYHKEKKMIEKHLKHPLQFYFPQGIGGVGEVTFVERTQVMGRHITLFHNISNFLRIGDVSYIDAKSFTLSAIGEIKSQKASANQIQISAHLIGKKRKLSLQRKTVTKTKTLEYSDPLFNYSLNDRLNRQKSNMINFLKIEGLEYDAKKKIESTFSIDFKKIEEAVHSVKKNGFYHFQYDDGMIVSIYKKKKSNLIKPLNKVSSSIHFPAGDDLVSVVKNSILKKSDYNSLNISSFYYGDQNSLNWSFLFTPPFWLPISPEFIKALYFQEIFMIVTFNPASIIEKLKSKGYSVIIKSSNMQFSISKKIGNKIFEISDFSYYLKLIIRYLIKEDSVLSIIDSMTKIKFRRKAHGKRLIIKPIIEF